MGSDPPDRLVPASSPELGVRSGGVGGGVGGGGTELGNGIGRGAGEGDASGVIVGASDLENHDEIEAFAAEMIDRFGALPDEVENLLSIVTIKQLCRKAGVSKIDAGPKGALLTFHNNTPPNVEALMDWITQKGGAIKLRPDQKLVAIRQWDTADMRVNGAKMSGYR